MTAAINTMPPIGALRKPRPRDVEDVPVGSTVRTPTGSLAKVIAHVGGRRGGGKNRDGSGNRNDDHDRLVCKYLKPKNKRFAIVRLLPELVEVVHGT